jgi:hypothetical protein
MPRATCRCGQRLSFPAAGPDRVICPKCQARIRVRRRDPAAEAAVAEVGDGFIRFACPCGRRLKVRETNPRQPAGRCPDCGRLVPVPAISLPRSSVGDPEAPTVDMDEADIAELARWAASYRKARPQPRPLSAQAVAPVITDVTAAPAESPALAATETFNPPIVTIPDGPLPEPTVVTTGNSPLKTEAGLRVCPRCGRPIHLGADTCRQCGVHVPRR